MRSSKTALCILVLATLQACSAQSEPGTEPPQGSSVSSTPMTVDEARRVVDEIRREIVGTEEPAPDPTSMTEVLEILRKDDVWRFPAAQKFAMGTTGADAITVRAMLELSWCEAQQTASRILMELAQRARADHRHRTEQGGEPDPDVAKMERYERASEALQVLAEIHMKAGGDLAKEAIREYSKHAGAHRAAAHYHRLAGDWLEFDREMKLLEDAGIDDAQRSYLRAMEALHRHIDRDKARALMRQALEKDPEVVRVQAQLVLLQDDITAIHTEYQALKAASPRHLIVVMVGSAIEAEHATSMELRKAQSDK
jgi:hypothetical protein